MWWSTFVKDNISPFHFYNVMHYPLPVNKEVFSYKEQYDCVYKGVNFSWSSKWECFDAFLVFVKKWQGLLINLPFVKDVYLANSIVFNAVNDSSDVDLFVVSKRNRIWISRLVMSLVFLFLWIKRTTNSSSKKFCLSFFVDEEHQDLSGLSLWKKDIYLPYWIAHLVPLYQESKNDDIFVYNKWILDYLPNIKLKQNIFLWIQCLCWKWKIKKIFEFLFWWKFWDVCENLVENFWWNRIQKIMDKNPESHRWVVVKKWVLKFYLDKRKEYSDLFFSNDN